MNDNAKEWVAALRSGEYSQGTGHLYDGINHCCLGVGCRIFGLAARHKVKKNGDGVWTFNGQDKELPLEVMEWLGLSSLGGNYLINGVFSALDIDNDDGKTFAELADIIESEPEGLFMEAQS